MFNLGEQLFDGLLIRDVNRDKSDIKFALGLFAGSRVDIGDDNCTATLCTDFRSGAANAHRAANDKNCLIAEIHEIAFLMPTACEGM
jgi:hypothetical protein